MLGAVLLGARRGRKTGVLVLAFTLGFASVEVAVHSVHHLGDPEGAASCQVLSASQHVAGAELSYPANLAETVAQETGAKLVELPSMAGGVPGVKDYISFVDYCVRTMVKAVTAG